MARCRYLELICIERDDGKFNVRNHRLGIDIVENTLGQAFKKLGNALKTKTVKELKEALE